MIGWLALGDVVEGDVVRDFLVVDVGECGVYLEVVGTSGDIPL